MASHAKKFLLWIFHLRETESSQASREPSSCCEGFSTTERRLLQSEAESSFQKWAGMSASAGTVRHQGTAEKPHSSRNLQEVQGVAEGWCTVTFSDEANFCFGNLEKSFVCGKSWDLWGTFTGLACLKHGAYCKWKVAQRSLDQHVGSMVRKPNRGEWSVLGSM